MRARCHSPPPSLDSCGWSPSYTIRAGEEQQDVRIECNALIHQMTGEDWSGVDLTFLGSLVSLDTPRHVDGAWGYGDPYYLPPDRVWGFDLDFEDPLLVPPLSPVLVYLRQELFVRQFPVLPARSDRVAPVPAKGPMGDPDPRRRLASLVFVQQHQSRHPPNDGFIETVLDDSSDGPVPFHVARQDMVQFLVWRQGVLVCLAGAKFS